MDAGPNLTSRKLGKLEPRENAQTFRLARYVDTAQLLPTVPRTLHRSQRVTNWPMYGNDRYGDCVFAEQGHHVQLLTAWAGGEVDVTEQDVLASYSRVTGFDPTTGRNDNGAVILDAMNDWRRNGIAGHRIGAFAKVDEHHHDLLKAAVFLFGGLSLGFAMPEAAQHMGRHWVKPRGKVTGANAPGSWGGHCTFAVDYTPAGPVVVTWGELTVVSWAFWDAYCDEAWVPISADWLTAGRSPDGFDLPALRADLAQVGQVH